METDQFEAPRAASVNDWSGASSEVTLYLTASDARRIVRALESTSIRLGGSPSGAKMASSYVRLAGVVRQQAATTR